VTETTFDLADVEHAAAALDRLDLEERDRAVLHAIFARAGEATAAEEGEVSGFSLNFTLVGGEAPDLNGNLMGSFQWGLRKSGGQLS